MAEVIKVLQDDANFLVELIDWEGAPAVRKSTQPGTDERRRATLQNEIIGTEYFNRLSKEHPQWDFRVPETFASSDAWVIREYISGEELLHANEPGENALSKLAKLATLLANIDDIEPDPSTYELDTNSAPYTNITKRLPVWSEKPLEVGMLSAADYQAAHDLIQSYQPLLQPRLAHGDLNPLKHVYEMSSGELAWIDFEHFSAQKPRYYDVAYCYSRMFTRMEDRGLAGQFLGFFFEKSRAEPHQKEQLLAIMTQRAIGMHFDAFNDAPHGVEYTDRAKRLLSLCLTHDVSSLLKG